MHLCAESIWYSMDPLALKRLMLASYGFFQGCLALRMSIKELGHLFNHTHHVTNTGNLKWLHYCKIEWMRGTVKVQGKWKLCSDKNCCAPNWTCHIASSIIRLTTQLLQIQPYSRKAPLILSAIQWPVIPVSHSIKLTRSSCTIEVPGSTYLKTRANCSLLEMSVTSSAITVNHCALLTLSRIMSLIWLPMIQMSWFWMCMWHYGEQ